ncbi:MAG: hypothetical protein V4679_00740 [Pseudomonadota bacterium]
MVADFGPDDFFERPLNNNRRRLLYKDVGVLHSCIRGPGFTAATFLSITWGRRFPVSAEQIISMRIQQLHQSANIRISWRATEEITEQLQEQQFNG